MVNFHRSGMTVIKEAFAEAAKGLICTPYYSERGLQILDPFCEAAEEVMAPVIVILGMEMFAFRPAILAAGFVEKMDQAKKQTRCPDCGSKLKRK